MLYFNGVFIGVVSTLATLLLVYSVTIFYAKRYMEAVFRSEGPNIARAISTVQQHSHSPPHRNNERFVTLVASLSDEQVYDLLHILDERQQELVNEILADVRSSRGAL